MGLFSFLFKPDMEPLGKIGKLIMRGQYEQCAKYLQEENPKKLSRCLNYQIGVKKKQGKDAMHAYQLLVEIFYLRFRKHARRYDSEYYNQCKQNASENDRPMCYDIQQIAPYFADAKEWKTNND